MMNNAMLAQLMKDMQVRSLAHSPVRLFEKSPIHGCELVASLVLPFFVLVAELIGR
jgi:hypothetical protein